MITLEKKEGIDYRILLKKRKLPILTLDSRWHSMFPKESKSRNIKKLESYLNSQLKKQGKATNEYKEMQKLKEKLMKEILQNMDSLPDEKREAVRQKKLEKSRQLINEINEKLEISQEQQDSFPSQIRRANEELMLASAEECYEKIQTNDIELKELTEWIDKTRVELKKRILIKQEKEEMNEKLYSYLHDMLGPEFMEAFDRAHKE